jgi:uncharacterized metal-binding protein
MNSKTLIVPCSGIGKTYGSVAREGAYVVTEDLRPTTTQLVPLSLVVLGDGEIRQTLAESKAISIDGCKLACAAKVVAEAGGTVAHAIQVLDIYRRNRRLKPDGIAELNEGGRQLAQILGEDVARLVDTLLEEAPHA